METINEAISNRNQHYKSSTNTARNSQERCSPENTRTATLQALPSQTDVRKWFSPDNWAYFNQNLDRCLTTDIVRLAEVDGLYNANGLALSILYQNIEGLYTLAMVKNDNAEERTRVINLASNMFFTKFGSQCSLYAMAIFFANYLSEFKTSFSAFDVQDILKAYKSRFVQWWEQKRERALREYRASIHDDDGQPVGLEALTLWLREAVENGEDVRAGGLYRLGYVTETMVKDMERQVWGQ